MRYKNFGGFALLIVLAFLQIMTLIGIAALHEALLEMKQAENSWRKIMLRSQASLALANAEMALVQALPSCLVPITSLSDLMVTLKSPVACVGTLQSMQYYYIVEDLGNDPCAYIQLSPTKITANYYRITVLGVLNGIQIAMQSSWIKPIDTNLPDCTIMHEVSAGRQMLRTLDTSLL